MLCILQHFYISHIFHNEHELLLEAVGTREKFTRRFYTWIVWGLSTLKAVQSPVPVPRVPVFRAREEPGI